MYPMLRRTSSKATLPTTTDAPIATQSRVESGAPGGHLAGLPPGTPSAMMKTPRATRMRIP